MDRHDEKAREIVNSLPLGDSTDEAIRRIAQALREAATPQWEPIETAPYAHVERRFVNEVGNEIHITAAVGADPSKLCQFGLSGPNSCVESYTTRMELQQLRDALCELLGSPSPPKRLLMPELREFANPVMREEITPVSSTPADTPNTAENNGS